MTQPSRDAQLVPLGVNELGKFSIQKDTNELFFDGKPVARREVHSLSRLTNVWAGIVAISALIATLSTGARNFIDVYKHFNAETKIDGRAAPPAADTGNGASSQVRP